VAEQTPPFPLTFFSFGWELLHWRVLFPDLRRGTLIQYLSWNLIVIQLVKKLSAFIGTKGSPPCSQKPTFKPYPKPADSCAHISAYLFKIHFHTCLPSMPRSKWPLPLRQCCPTFSYTGAHLTDGCGGAGAVWRLQ
jgi:hypothetical protein